MRKRTTTKQLQNAITNNLLTIVKAECHYKSSSRIDEISADKFKDSLDFLCESGCFMDVIGWHYERDYKTGDYEIECSRMNPHSEIIIIAHLCACENVSNEDIEQALLFLED